MISSFGWTETFTRVMASVVVILAAACDAARCRTDINCPDSLPLCDDGLCVARGPEFTVGPVPTPVPEPDPEPEPDGPCPSGQAPVLAIAPAMAVVDFGTVSVGDSGERVVSLSNLGDCALTLLSLGLSDQGSSGFGCEPCDPQAYPQRVPPGENLDIRVTFSPTEAREATGTLYIRTDDTTAGDEGLVAISLRANAHRDPVLVVEPFELNFGRVAFNIDGAEGSAVQVVQIVNRGGGNAPLALERISVEEGTAFSIPPEFTSHTADNPLLVPPYDPNNPASVVAIPITFRPDSNADFVGALVVQPQDGTPVMRRLKGTSLGPPQMNVSATSLVFKCGVGLPAGATDPCPTEEAYPAGAEARRSLVVSNSGQSELHVTLTLEGEAGDFTVSPAFLPPIPAGGAFAVTVRFHPSGPSDPANPTGAHPAEAFDAVLNILSNDTDPPADALKTVALEGHSRAAQSGEVLKLELEFDNADNAWGGNDFRDVDLELVSPLGRSCRKNRNMTQDGAGGFVTNPDLDPCAAWNASGADEGIVRWISAGPFDEPERIVLHGPGPTSPEGDVFTVRVHFIDDCADMPVGFLADIIGVGGSTLLGWLGGSAGVSIPVAPDQISDLIEENCFDRAGTTVTVHVSLDGQVIASPQVQLSAKGQVGVLANLQRRNGRFCDPNIGIPCP